eukprot:jgi/Botrbrau1/986/Bobra.114_1s0026.1
MLSMAPTAVDPAGSAVAAVLPGKPTTPSRGLRSMFGFGAFMPNLQCIPEGSDLPAVPQTVAKALPSRLGESVGEILSQTLTGSALNPVKAFETAAYGVAVEAVAPGIERDGRSTGGTAAKCDNGFLFWGPLVACAFVGGLKLLEGHPEEIFEACQEKIITFTAANYVLFPLASFCINNSIIPEEHKGTARQILTVVWNAWLATVGHSAVASMDTAGLVEQTAESLHLPASSGMALLTHAAGQGPLSQASPFFARAAEAAQGVAQMAEKLPSGLLEKMFSHSLDLISPLGERSPSDVLETAHTLEQALVERLRSSSLDPMLSANLERLLSGGV